MFIVIVFIKLAVNSFEFHYYGHPVDVTRLAFYFRLREQFRSKLMDDAYLLSFMHHGFCGWPNELLIVFISDETRLKDDLQTANQHLVHIRLKLV